MTEPRRMNVTLTIELNGARIVLGAGDVEPGPARDGDPADYAADLVDRLAGDARRWLAARRQPAAPPEPQQWVDR